jgi:disulfide oxidoreductase YuzD
MAMPEEAERHKDLLAQVQDRYFFYPLVFVNGELKLVGSAEYYEVLHVVRELLQPQPS